jgi:hypothetical protein
MNSKNEYFSGDYNFLKKINYQIFKPNEDLICCSDLVLNTLGGKICTNFTDPIKLLLDKYKVPYYNNLLEIINENPNIFKIPMVIKSDANIYIKEIVYRYIESNYKYKIIISFEPLDIKYDIYYELNDISFNQIIGILFQIDFMKNKINTYEYYKQLTQDFNKTLHCYYVEKYDDNAIIVSGYNSVRELSQVLFNNLSLEVLHLSRLDRIISKKCISTIFNHIIYKRFLYSKIKTIDQIRFMLFSCSILFSLGTTSCQDIDLLVYSENIGKEVNMVIDEYFIKDKFPLIDFHMKGYGDWTIDGKKAYLNDWFIKEWPNLYGSKDLEQTIFDPRFHYYFLGMKFISYKADIMRRVKRNRATAYTDLIMLNYFNGLIIKPEKLEREYWQNNEKIEYSDKNLVELILKIIKNAIRWHGIKIPAERVYKYIIWPDEFKLNYNNLHKIDIDINKWINYSKLKIKKDEENKNKHELIIEQYKNRNLDY